MAPLLRQRVRRVCDLGICARIVYKNFVQGLTPVVVGMAVKQPMPVAAACDCKSESGFQRRKQIFGR